MSSDSTSYFLTDDVENLWKWKSRIPFITFPFSISSDSAEQMETPPPSPPNETTTMMMTTRMDVSLVIVTHICRENYAEEEPADDESVDEDPESEDDPAGSMSSPKLEKMANMM